MNEEPLDDVDREILHLLQEDARNNTNAEISDRVGVSPSTVGNRIKRMEDSGIIRGYPPEIDYGRAALPLHVLLVCTARIADRSDAIDRILEVPGVVSVRELMTGERNLQIEVVGGSHDDITRLATTIDDLGVSIREEILVKNEYFQPASVFDG